MRPLSLFASKDRFKIESNITIHVGAGALSTRVLFSVLETLDINVLLGTALIDEHILAIILDEEKVSVQRWTTFHIVSQYNLSTTFVFRKVITQNANMKNDYKAKEDQRWTIDHSNTVSVSKQKWLAHLPL